MSPRSSNQFAKMRYEKRKLILETALELFAEFGYHATSINLIAQKAKISKGLTYNYFSSKKEILDEIINDNVVLIEGLLCPYEHKILSDDEFLILIGNAFDTIIANRRHWQLFYSVLIQPSISDNLGENYTKTSRPFLNKIIEFIESRNSKNPDVDIMSISAMIEGSWLCIIAGPDLFPMRELKANIIKGIQKILYTD